MTTPIPAALFADPAPAQPPVRADRSAEPIRKERSELVRQAEPQRPAGFRAGRRSAGASAFQRPAVDDAMLWPQAGQLAVDAAVSPSAGCPASSPGPARGWAMPCAVSRGCGADAPSAA
jgi:hypothetical protein